LKEDSFDTALDFFPRHERYLREVVDSLRHPGGELRAWSGLIRNGNVPRADSDNFKR